ncbi:hypothetical protein SNEBB_003811 [Seison nebaliae]|nr:hypothetical protein SNEBB_003811 [Seison nebaliae]
MEEIEEQVIEEEYEVIDQFPEHVITGGRKRSVGIVDSWKLQSDEYSQMKLYKLVDSKGDGLLVTAYLSGGKLAVLNVLETYLNRFLYRSGLGGTVTKEDHIRWTYNLHLSLKRSNELRNRVRPFSLFSLAPVSRIMRSKLARNPIQKTNDVNCCYPKGKRKQNYCVNNDEVAAKFWPWRMAEIFEEHQTCWSLFERGHLGETVVHILFRLRAPMYTQIAFILIDMYPMLVNDIFEGEEYYGQNLLHLAIIDSDLESVKKLVERGIDVNCRAVGRFFLPEDQKGKHRKKMTETNYDGFAYYGQYPLAFAACLGLTDIYDYLLEHGANPNIQDSFGNTIVHMLVIKDNLQMLKYVLKHEKIKGDLTIRNHAQLTPMALSAKIGRKKIFIDMLDMSSITLWRFSKVICSLYPTKDLDTVDKDGKTDWLSPLLFIVNGTTSEHIDMLQGGVVFRLLKDKWDTFAQGAFVSRLVLLIFHLIFMSIAIYARPTYEVEGRLLQFNETTDYIRVVAEILNIIFGIISIFNLMILELYTQGWKYFLNSLISNNIKAMYLLGCFLWLFAIPFRFIKMSNERNRIIEESFIIIACPLLWMYLLFFASGVKLTGPFVTMISKMITGDMMKFGIIYLIFGMCYTCVFYFLYRDLDKVDKPVMSGFKNIFASMAAIFHFTLGEFKYDEFQYIRYKWLAKIIFFIFMILVPILLLNMLIAMMGNTYSMVIADSEKEWRRQWAQIILSLERSYNSKTIVKYLDQILLPIADGRAVMVIQNDDRTAAGIRKGAIGNWKRYFKLIMRQIRENGGTATNLKLRPINELGEDPQLNNMLDQLLQAENMDLSASIPKSKESTKRDKVRKSGGRQSSKHRSTSKKRYKKKLPNDNKKSVGRTSNKKTTTKSKTLSLTDAESCDTQSTIAPVD